MNFVELSRPHISGRFVTPAVRRGQDVIASLIEGRCEHAAPAHANTGGLSLPNAQLTVHATSCSWPLLCAEAQDLAVLTGFDTLIVRTVPGRLIGTYLSSIDLLLHEYPRWLLGYRPWIGDRHDDNLVGAAE